MVCAGRMHRTDSKGRRPPVASRPLLSRSSMPRPVAPRRLNVDIRFLNGGALLGRPIDPFLESIGLAKHAEILALLRRWL